MAACEPTREDRQVSGQPLLASAAHVHFAHRRAAPPATRGRCLCTFTNITYSEFGEGIAEVIIMAYIVVSIIMQLACILTAKLHHMTFENIV